MEPYQRVFRYRVSRAEKALWLLAAVVVLGPVAAYLGLAILLLGISFIPPALGLSFGGGLATALRVISLVLFVHAFLRAIELVTEAGNPEIRRWLLTRRGSVEVHADRLAVTDWRRRRVEIPWHGIREVLVSRPARRSQTPSAGYTVLGVIVEAGNNPIEIPGCLDDVHAFIAEVTARSGLTSKVESDMQVRYMR